MAGLVILNLRKILGWLIQQLPFDHRVFVPHLRLFLKIFKFTESLVTIAAGGYKSNATQ